MKNDRACNPVDKDLRLRYPSTVFLSQMAPPIGQLISKTS